MLAKGQLVWVSAKVGDTEGTRNTLKKHGHLWVVDQPSLSDPNWIWCHAYGSKRVYDFHETELTLHQPTPNEEGVTD